jgi:hypothetical protein
MNRKMVNFHLPSTGQFSVAVDNLRCIKATSPRIAWGHFTPDCVVSPHPGTARHQGQLHAIGPGEGAAPSYLPGSSGGAVTRPRRGRYLIRTVPQRPGELCPVTRTELNPVSDHWTVSRNKLPTPSGCVSNDRHLTCFASGSLSTHGTAARAHRAGRRAASRTKPRYPALHVTWRHPDEGAPNPERRGMKGTLTPTDRVKVPFMPNRMRLCR